MKNTTETKTFKELLEALNYKYNYKNQKEEELKKLDRACVTYLKSNGAQWYFDFNNGLKAYLSQMFEEGKILNHSYVKRIPRWVSPENVQEYTEENNENIRKKIEYKGLLELERFREQRQNSFKINNIYTILRTAYNLSREDRLEFELRGLVTAENFEEIKSKAAKLSEKNMLKSTEKLQRNIASLTSECMNLCNVPFRVQDRFITDRQEHNVNTNALLENIYLKIACRLPIAYLTEQSAMDFFETSTGILLRKPRENKIYIFGGKE